MKCPGCGNEANITIAREEHIYPELFLGLPTFWRFMSPAVARAVTAIILVFSVAPAWLTLVCLNRGSCQDG